MSNKKKTNFRTKYRVKKLNRKKSLKKKNTKRRNYKRKKYTKRRYKNKNYKGGAGEGNIDERGPYIIPLPKYNYSDTREHIGEITVPVVYETIVKLNEYSDNELYDHSKRQLLKIKGGPLYFDQTGYRKVSIRVDVEQGNIVKGQDIELSILVNRRMENPPNTGIFPKRISHCNKLITIPRGNNEITIVLNNRYSWFNNKIVKISYNYAPFDAMDYYNCR